MASHVEPSTTPIEESRHELCHRIAVAIREGEYGMQVRFVHTGETISEVWFYTKRHHEWTKRDDLALSLRFADSLLILLEGLSKHDFADACSCHRTDHGNLIDFELKFLRDSIEPHVKGNLESYLIGCLSHTHHDSGKDARRQIRFRS